MATVISAVESTGSEFAPLHQVFLCTNDFSVEEGVLTLIPSQVWARVGDRRNLPMPLLQRVPSSKSIQQPTALLPPKVPCLLETSLCRWRPDGNRILAIPIDYRHIYIHRHVDFTWSFPRQQRHLCQLVQHKGLWSKAHARTHKHIYKYSKL